MQPNCTLLIILKLSTITKNHYDVLTLLDKYTNFANANILMMMNFPLINWLGGVQA